MRKRRHTVLFGHDSAMLPSHTDETSGLLLAEFCVRTHALGSWRRRA